VTPQALDKLLDEQRQPMARLVARHPELLPAVLQYTSHVPPGWESLVDRLLSEIAAYPEGVRRVAIQQVKERCASLTVYCYVNGRQHLRTAPRGSTNFDRVYLPTAHPNLLVDIQGLLESAAAASRLTCQACGAAGAIVIRHGYLTVACALHTSWRNAFRERRMNQLRSRG
jgi:hypothetical protein